MAVGKLYFNGEFKDLCNGYIYNGTEFKSLAINTYIYNGNNWIPIDCINGGGGSTGGGGDGDTTTAPSAPSNLNDAPLNTSDVGLTWNDNSNNESNFEVWRSVNNGSYSLKATVSANSTSYLDTSTNIGTKYTYKVRATNSAGNSAFSNTTSITR